jgi:hypothetical protein
LGRLNGFDLSKNLTPFPSPQVERRRVMGKSGEEGKSNREILYLDDFRGFILETIP